MATATAKTEKVYQLTLDKDEAEALSVALAYISGDRVKSPVKHTDEVYRALDAAGVDYFEAKIRVGAPLYGGTGIRFENYPAA